MTDKDNERVTRKAKPTASFSLNLSTLVWIGREAIKRGIPKSQVVEEAVRNLMDDEKEAAA
jgi:hypothetical protein